MATTKISQIIIRKDNLDDIPTLSTGEFMLAEDEQRLFLGQKPITGVIVDANTSDVEVSFTVQHNSIVTALQLSKLANYKISAFRNSNSTTNSISDNDVTVSDQTVDGINAPVFKFRHGFNDTHTAGSFVVGKLYTIKTVGTTDFTSIGSANNNVGTNFTANAVGTGTGTATTGVEPTNADTFKLLYNKEITPSISDDKVNKRLATKFTNTGDAVETTGIKFFSSLMNDITMDYTLFNATHMRKGTLNILVRGNTNSSIEDKFIGDSELDDIDFSITNDGAGEFTLNFKTPITTELYFNYTQTATRFV